MPGALIGQILVGKGHLRPELLEVALDLQEIYREEGDNRKIGEILIEEGWLDEKNLWDALLLQQSS
jgi:hypothetical protein